MVLLEFNILPAALKNVANSLSMFYRRLRFRFKQAQILSLVIVAWQIKMATIGAIVQQLQRPEILNQLRPLPRGIVRHRAGHTLLRHSVQQFMMKSRHPRITMFRAQYEELDGLVNEKTWEE